MRVYCKLCKSMSNPTPEWKGKKCHVTYPCCGDRKTREEAAKDRVYQVNHYFLADGTELVRKNPETKPTWEMKKP